MKIRQYFLLLFMVFSLLGFNAKADMCSSPATCSNVSCTGGDGLLCSETGTGCNCFDTGFTYWNSNTCNPSIYFDPPPEAVWLVTYACNLPSAPNMNLNASKECVCNSGYYMVDDDNNYMNDPVTASGCNSCSGTPIAPGTWTCDGGTTAPHKLCSAYSELYDTGNVIYPNDTSGCSCAGHSSTISCTPSCGPGYTGVPGTQTLTDCVPLTYSACSSTTCDPNTIDISYNSGGGTGSAPSSPTIFSYGTTTNAPANAIPGGYTKVGYTFAGWGCTGGRPGICDNGQTFATGDNIGSVAYNGTIALTAQWVPETFTLHVNPNNGGSVTDVTCTIGTPCDFEPDPFPTAPSGYTFLDWNKQLDGSDPASYTSPHTFPDASVSTLYARWIKTITFDGNGGSPATQDISCYHNGNLADPILPNAPPGFYDADDSWYQDNHGETVAYSSSTPIECDDAIYSTVYPKWNYQVIYDGNGRDGGAVVPVITICTKNKDCDLTDIPAMTRTGYTLDMDNWYSNDTGIGGTNYPDTGTINNPAGNITLFAKWTLCGAGYWVDSGSCEECDVGYYCPGDGTNPKCPAGHTSDALSTAKSNCYMSSGTKFCDTDGTRCFHLPISNIYWHGI